MTAGPDEVRDRVPISSRALRRLIALRVLPIPGSTGSSSPLSTLAPLALAYDRPADGTASDGRAPCRPRRAPSPPRRSGRSCWPAPRPRPGAACAPAAARPRLARRLSWPCQPDHRGGADHQQPADVAVALLADAAEPLLAAAAMRVAASARARPRTGGRSGTATASGTAAAMALAVIGPMPGIVASRRLAASLRCQARISRLGLFDLARLELADAG